MSESGFTNQEIDSEHVWMNIGKGKSVRAAVLTPYGIIHRGVYKLEDETIAVVKEMVRLAGEGENIRFYILEKVKEDE